MGVDYDHELSNGWDKWQNLVLTAMRENRDAITHVTELVGTVVTAQAVQDERMTTMSNQIGTVTTLADGTVARVVVLETNDTKRIAVVKGAWVAIGVAASFVAGLAGLGIGVAQLFVG